MTRDQKLLIIWCTAAAIVLGVVATLFSSRGSELDAARTKATGLHREYLTLYPDAGVPASESLAVGERLRDHQEQARTDAERDLVGVLPEDYQRSDVTEASSRMRADLGALKQRAERQKIALPASLPFESSGFDQTKVSLQLAQLYLYKQVLDLCMDAGITRVSTVKEGKCHRDASGVYAVLTCEFAIDGNFEALSQVINGLRAKHAIGLGVRDLKLSQGAQSGQCSLTASLLTANNPQWKLEAEGAPAKAAGVPGTPPRRRSALSGGG